MPTGPYLIHAAFRVPMDLEAGVSWNAGEPVFGILAESRFDEHGNALHVQADMQLVLVFNSGGYRGQKTLTLHPEMGDSDYQRPLSFAGEDSITQHVMGFQIGVDRPGIHWFDVLLDDVWMTRISMRVDYTMPTLE